MSKSRTITRLAPIHPGEVVADALAEAGVTANAAAIAMGVPANRLTAILKGQRAVTADTALRLGLYFGTTPRIWMNLQASYDLQTAEDRLSAKIASEVRPLKLAS